MAHSVLQEEQENFCAMGQCSDTTIRGPLLDSLLLFAQLVRFTFCYKLVLAVNSPLEVKGPSCSRQKHGASACACAHLLCNYVCLPGAQNDLAKFKTVATVAPRKMWDCPENGYCRKCGGLSSLVF